MASLKSFNPQSEGSRGEIVRDRSGDQASGFMKKPIHRMNRFTELSRKWIYYKSQYALPMQGYMPLKMLKTLVSNPRTTK